MAMKLKIYISYKDYILLFILICFSGLINAQNDSSNTEVTDTIQPGVQGSVIPLSDNTFILTGDELLDTSFPNSWPLFGSGIRMGIGGYAKADFIHDFEYVGDPYEFELGSIAVEGSPERELGGASTFHVKQTRVNLDFRSKAVWKNGKEFPLQVFVEIDWFFDDPNLALNTRLRHAYGVIGRLLVGRTWTTSVDLSTIPGTIDFSGGDALYGGRVTQIRWQDKISKRLSYAVALEEPGGQVDNPDNLPGETRLKMPNLAGMMKFKSEKGSTIQLGLDAFSIRWAGTQGFSDYSEFGYALSLTSRILFKLRDYSDAIIFGGGYGKGQGHKIISLSWDGKASGTIDENGLTLNNSWWAFAGFNHYWSKSLNSNFSTAWTSTDLQPSQEGSTIKRAGSFHANLIWFPYKKVSTGIEYMWGVRENNSGIEGTASRVQFMVKYKFN